MGNRAFLKLCADGAFKLSREGYVIATLGMLTKHFALDRLKTTDTFTTTYHELAISVMLSEHETCFTRQMNHVNAAMATLVQEPVFSSKVGQCLGLEHPDIFSVSCSKQVASSHRCLSPMPVSRGSTAILPQGWKKLVRQSTRAPAE